MTARIQTYTGLMVDPLHLSIQDIRLEDIAHALSNLCRFTGHVREFYSVAEHSVWVSHLVPEWAAKYALIHDASEAYLQDIPRPLKQTPEFTFYREAEAGAMDTIRVALGVPAACDPELKKECIWQWDREVVSAVDTAMLHFEAKELMRAEWASARLHRDVQRRMYARFGWTWGMMNDPRESKRAFLDRAAELGIA